MMKRILFFITALTLMLCGCQNSVETDQSAGETATATESISPPKEAIPTKTEEENKSDFKKQSISPQNGDIDCKGMQMPYPAF